MFRFLLIIAALAFSTNNYAYERVVLLAPAAGDLFIQLQQQHKVVGVTRNNDDFKDALKIGSHIKPNIELIKSLNPDLIIIDSTRFFSDEMASLLGAKTVIYNPVTLNAVLEQIHHLGTLLDCPNQANELVTTLTQVLQKIKPLVKKPSVIYEVTQMPLTIAGKGNIVSDIIHSAGGELMAPSTRKLIKFNVESVLVSQPDYYLYQIGPMNPNPQPPETRQLYKMLPSKFIQVEQLSYSRANSQSFYIAAELNRQFNKS
ncbi:ABC transporter substrate-binding protein [Shewanella livingstonensis]